jgi:hypothetical protein
LQLTQIVSRTRQEEEFVQERKLFESRRESKNSCNMSYLQLKNEKIQYLVATNSDLFILPLVFFPNAIQGARNQPKE